MNIRKKYIGYVLTKSLGTFWWTGYVLTKKVGTFWPQLGTFWLGTFWHGYVLTITQNCKHNELFCNAYWYDSCLAISRNTEKAPKHRNGRVNTLATPKTVLNITPNDIKLHFYVNYTNYTYYDHYFQLDTYYFQLDTYNTAIHFLPAISHHSLFPWTDEESVFIFFNIWKKYLALKLQERTDLSL